MTGHDAAREAELWPGEAAVIGAGTMGAGIAVSLALGAVPTMLVDQSARTAAEARERAIERVRDAAGRGVLDAGAAERLAANLRVGEAVEAAASAALVVEAVPEDRATKRAILGRIEATTSATATVATNTSAIPIAELAESLAFPQRFLGAHWFNPAEWVPCVELIPAPATESGHVERVARLLERLGKQPVVVGDSAGFVANRIQFAMFREAAAVVAEGIASPADVDAVVRSSFGFRLPFYGPFEIADMAGLDVYAGAYAALERAHGPERAAPPAVSELVAAGRLGVKGGGGFLPAPPADELVQRLEERDAHLAALRRLLADRRSDSARGPDGERTLVGDMITYTERLS